MPVFVDQLLDWPLEGIKRGARRYGSVWCHLYTDTGNEKELHEMAQRIGLRRAWFQNRGGFPHYDIVPAKRKLALDCGAVERPLRSWVKEAV